MFVYDYSGKLGTGYFSKTNLAIHLNPFLENDDKKVTRYDTTAHLPYNQYWIQLKAVWDEIFDPDGKPTSGHCEGYLGKNVSPECKIDLKHLNDLYPNDPNAKPWIIAHELGHAVTFDYRECTNPSCIMNQVIPATTYCSNCRELIHLHP